MFIASASKKYWMDSLLQWVKSDPAKTADRLQIITTTAGVIVFIPFVWMGVYFWKLGQSIKESGRFPAPGMKVTRDTPVLYGDEALLRGTLLKFAAVVMFVLGFMILGVLIALGPALAETK
jgi:hypothetical protein